MTPTTKAFEDRLHDALLDRFDALSSQPLSSPVRTPRRFPARRLAIPVGALAAAASVSVLILDPGGGVRTGTARTNAPALALAAWTSQPTPANQGETSGAEAQCSAALNAPGGPGGSADKASPPPPAGGPWNPVLVDTRADLTLALYSNGTTWIACLDTPSFIAVNAFGTNSDDQVPGTSATLDKLSTKGTSGSTYTVAIGRAGSSVTGMVLQRTDGSAVTATLGNGHYIAWWPGTVGVTALSITTETGTQTAPVDQRFAQPVQPGNRTVHELPPTSQPR